MGYRWPRGSAAPLRFRAQPELHLGELHLGEPRERGSGQARCPARARRQRSAQPGGEPGTVPSPALRPPSRAAQVGAPREGCGGRAASRRLQRTARPGAGGAARLPAAPLCPRSPKNFTGSRSQPPEVAGAGRRGAPTRCLSRQAVLLSVLPDKERDRIASPSGQLTARLLWLFRGGLEGAAWAGENVIGWEIVTGRAQGGKVDGKSGADLPCASSRYLQEGMPQLKLSSVKNL